MNYGKTIKITLILAVVIITSAACMPNSGLRNFTGVRGSPVTGEKTFMLPRRAYVRGLPTGDDGYSVGFRNGCQTGMGVIGTGTMRLLPERIDSEKLIDDNMYMRGWHDGISHCSDRLDLEGH